jgi:putative transposase
LPNGDSQNVQVDNGPEFAGQVLDSWAYAQGVHLTFIEPGKPMQNGFIESFNGTPFDHILHWTIERRRSFARD